MKAIFLFLLIQFALPLWASIDVHTIVENDCKLTTGIIIHGAIDQLTLLDAKGDLQIVARGNILKILSYSVNEGPVSTFTIDEQNQHYFNEITLIDGQIITGVPFRFVEELIFIYSISGETHVFSPSEIKTIGPAKFRGASKPQFKHHNFAVKEHLSSCQIPDEAKSGFLTHPIQIISDKIKMEEFLLGFQNGSQRLNDLSERMNFYPRPYLYPKRSRLGLVVENDSHEAPNNIPLFYQWSTGERYHFQSVNTIGGYRSPYLPMLAPNHFSVASEFKSHFFQGFFQGNLTSLRAGENNFYPDDIQGEKNFNLLSGYNHIILIGAGYKNYSLSFGVLQSTLGWWINDRSNQTIFREILAKKPSHIISLGYISDNTKLRFTYSKTKHQGSGHDIRSGLLHEESSTGDGDNYRINYYYLRTDIEYETPLDLTVSFSEVLLSGDYLESIGGISGANDYKIIKSGFTLSKEFGHYVNLKFELTLTNNKITADFHDEKFNLKNHATSYGGILEFLF